jgi:ArsR family transcriptional regulator, arsenate/arsenite/antimonite-responsive transcriptional repressor
VNPDRSDAIWEALAHPSRRRILEILRAGPRRGGELAELLAGTIARTTVILHVNILVEAGLVVREKVGREVIHHYRPELLREQLAPWLEEGPSG